MIRAIANLLLELSWRASAAISTWLESSRSKENSSLSWKPLAIATQNLVDFERLESKFVPGESITAFRLAYLVWQPDSVKFRSLAKFHHFGAGQEVAKCYANHFHKSGHPIPSEHCHCGYYSLSDPVLLPDRTSNIANADLVCLLQVDLQGIVIPGDSGYRAEVQEVLKAWIQSRCHVCSAPIESLQAKSTTRIKKPPNFIDTLILPFCSKHLDKNEPTYSLDEIRQALGTEVAWL